MGSDDQDPGYYVEKGYPEVTKAAVDSLRTRYQLLHYLYTSFYHSHAHGSTLVRPFAHEFPHDPAARQIGDRFFLGSSILVNPFLYEVTVSLVFFNNINKQNCTYSIKLVSRRTFRKTLSGTSFWAILSPK